jgi:hypothetical protein
VDFFVSYTGRDEQWAEWITWVLTEQGYKCLFQKWDFHVGDDFVRRMHESLNRAKKTIAVLSPDYLKSKYAIGEAFAALRAEKLLPVRVRACDPGGLIGNRVYVGLDSAASEDEAARLLLEGVSKERRAPKERPVFPGPHRADRPPFPHEPQASKARAPVLAVEAELGQHAASVAERLRRMDWIGSVAVVDAAGAGGSAPDVDLVVAGSLRFSQG